MSSIQLKVKTQERVCKVSGMFGTDGFITVTKATIDSFYLTLFSPSSKLFQ